MKNIRKVWTFLLLATVALTFTACGSSDSAKYDMPAATESYSSNAWGGDYGYAEEAWNEDADYSYDSNGSDMPAEEVKDSSRKLIKTYDIDVETEDFEPFSAELEAKVVSLGGYIENLNVYNGSAYSGGKSLRYSNLIARIPANKSDEFLSMVGEKANITNQSLSVEDVTLAYVDVESKKNAYEAEQKRLLDLLDHAETIEDILIIEDRLTTVRYYLESMGSQLRTYDNLVDYSTFHISINEVRQYTEPVVEPDSFGEKIVKSFTRGFRGVVDGLGDFVVGFAGALPGLVVFAIICVIIVLIVRACVKSSKKKQAIKQAKLVQPYYATPVQPQVQNPATPVQNVNEPTNNTEDNKN